MPGRNCWKSPFWPPTALQQWGLEAAGKSLPPAAPSATAGLQQDMVSKSAGCRPGLVLQKKPRAPKRKKGLNPSSEGGNRGWGWSQKLSPKPRKPFLGPKHQEILSPPKSKLTRKLSWMITLLVQTAAGLEQDCFWKAWECCLEQLLAQEQCSHPGWLLATTPRAKSRAWWLSPTPNQPDRNFV